jgi:predicted AlkP superfamily phosphohydrolase/phosphomutase
MPAVRFAGTAPGAALAAIFLAGTALAQSPHRRVVILGFDGVDAGIVQRQMEKGRLPNLAALRARGGFTPLLPPIPPQTPVSWSSFSTGLDPGSTRIFDFLKRDPKTLAPTFAIAEEKEVPLYFGRANPWVFAAIVLLLLGFLPQIFARRWWRWAFLAAGLGLAGATFSVVRADIPTVRPTAVNNRQGETLWRSLGDAGKKVVVIRMPVTFPPDHYPHGDLLAGLGVPDVSGRIGRPSYYTSDPFFSARNGNDFSIELVRLDSNVGTIATRIAGPPAKYFGKAEPWLDTPMTLVVDGDRSGLTIETSGQNVHLRAGQWSDWVPLTFRANALVSLSGMAKFKLEEVNPEIKLYLSPVNFDPRRLPPGFHVTFPAGFARELVSEGGLYKTMGWKIDTWSIQSGTIDEKTFLQDVDQTVARERKTLDTLLADKSIDCAVQYFEFPDRISHIMWRFRDPRHPAYDPKLAKIYGDAVEKSYDTMDEIVGQAEKQLSPDDVLIVLSDHGFADWRRSVNYDSWLVQNGYLVLKGQSQRKSLEALFSHGAFWDAVDWSKTRAYAMGLGEIYVNLAGREAHGIVQPGAEYEKLRDELIARLSTLTDPKDGERAVSRVVRREEAYRKFDPNLIPDLFVLNTDGFRVSWQSSLGVPTDDVFEDNTDVWSGDHCSVDPRLVEGVFFASVPLHNHGVPSIMDVDPSVLGLFGVAPPAGIDGKAFFGPGAR